MSKPVPWRQWLWLNLKIGALSFGSSARLFLYEEGVVIERAWLGEEDFRRIFLMTQVLPGPNLVNLCVYLGFALRGAGGALAGLIALALPGALLALLLVFFVNLNQPVIARLFEGFSLASVALFSVFVWRMARGLARPQEGSRLKTVARGLIVLGVALASLAALPLLGILAVGVVAGLVAESLP